MLTTELEFLRKAQLTGVLELACQELELSSSQLELAEQRYMAIGNWLAAADDPHLRRATIYPQGSISLRTMVKPIGRNEHDVDLVCFVPTISSDSSPAMLKRLIGDRLSSNDRYKSMLEEKPRCWRINYANEFHLDITPSIPNPSCPAGGELVPDRTLRGWKATNPKGYRRWFEEQAALQPTILLYDAKMAAARAEVEALPGPSRFKGILRRCVQLFKRHRDVFFAARAPELAPISIILTTLAAKSYALCVARNRYEAELDVLVDVMSTMPAFVERVWIESREQYFVRNETTQGENFAEKWNANPRLAESFYLWQRQALQDFQGPLAAAGLDQVQAFGERTLGEAQTRLVIPAFDRQRCSVHIFKTPHHDRLLTDWKQRTVDVALATAAAPTYLPGHRLTNGISLLDGGIWANNPTGVAVVEAIGILGWDPRSLHVLSLGCTEAPSAPAEQSGMAGLALQMADLFLLGQSRGAMGTAKLLMGAADADQRLFRFQHVANPGEFELDAVDQIPALKGIGAAMAREALPRVVATFLAGPREPFVPLRRPGTPTV